MFNVTKDSLGRFKISVGTGQSFRANSFSEVSTALKHYYGAAHNRKNCTFCKSSSR